jgi:hypothetical protein
MLRLVVWLMLADVSEALMEAVCTSEMLISIYQTAHASSP